MKAYEKLYQRILNNEKILIDGATGSEVERSGFKRTDGAWLSKVCLSNIFGQKTSILFLLAS